MPRKNFSKIFRSEPTLNCRVRHSHIKLTHSLWGVWEAMYVCMYVYFSIVNDIRRKQIQNKCPSSSCLSFRQNKCLNCYFTAVYLKFFLESQILETHLKYIFQHRDLCWWWRKTAFDVIKLQTRLPIILEGTNSTSR